MSTQDIRDLIGRLSTSASALSALGAALGARASQHQPAPEARACIDEVLAELGVRDAVSELDAAAARPLLGHIRMTFLQGSSRVTGIGGAPGWRPLDEVLLQAAGDVSAGFPEMLDRVLSSLDGLPDRLASPGACFLDVGAGVAALAIEMARRWPTLRVVGIDVWAPALQLARDHVSREGLLSRVELREQAIQDLTDQAAFDLAWIPSAFIPTGVIPEALRRAHRALRPGGWILFGTIAPGDDPLAASLTRLRAAEWGSRAWSAAEAEGLLRASGFTDVRPLLGPPAGVTFIAARSTNGDRP
jgi:2-polyprenyl-3-methyl-5-hydroxy-6-metoxy-1,4-benzoquinol methylase